LKNKKKIIALIVTIGLLGFILHKIDWQQLIETFQDFDFKNIFYIVLLYVSTLYLRGIRWKALLLNDKKYSALHLGQVFTVGSMLNVFLPMRAGDAYRAYYLGTLKGERKLKVFGSVILERIFDGVCVFFILLAAVLLYSKQPWILNLALGIGTLFIGSLAAFYILYKNIDKLEGKSFNNKILTLLTHIKNFMSGFVVLDDAKCFTASFFLSFVIWGIECFVAYLIVDSFSLGLGFAAGMFVISLICSPR